jgi:hypothetical protein
VILPYQGKTNDIKITLKNDETLLPSIITKFPKKDSLQIWFKPLKVDSLQLAVAKNKYKGDFTFSIKAQKKDSLKISAVQNSILNFREQFTLETATPMTKFDYSKIKIINKDSVSVAFTPKYDDFNQQISFDFKKEPSEKYTFSIMPGALTDYLERSNDTLIYRLATKDLAEYGNLTVRLQNVKNFPVIVELTNEKGDVLATEYSESNTKVEFNLVEPSLFTLRLIYDDNKNKEYDSGNYLEKRQAEEIVYFSKTIDVRANWDVEQVFDVSIPYTPETKKKVDNKNKGKSSIGL